MVVVDRPHLLAGDPLGDDDAFGRRHVRELRMHAVTERDDVADRGYVRHGRSIELVHLDVALVHRDAGLLDPEPGRHRPAARRDEQDIGRQLLRLAVGSLRLDVHAVRAARLRCRHLRPGQRLDALLLERLLELRGNRFVFDRHEPRQQFDDRHLAAEAAVDRRELDADRAAAHDDERLRDLLQT